MKLHKACPTHAFNSAVALFFVSLINRYACGHSHSSI